MPTSVPSRLAPTSTRWTCARPWFSESIDSLRDLEPPDRPTRSCAAFATHEVLRVDQQLRAEAAADVGRDHAHLRAGHAEQLREVVADVERAPALRNPHGPGASPSGGTTAMPFTSIGTGATRWFTNRPRTTTSAPASTSSSQRVLERVRDVRPDARATAAVHPRRAPTSGSMTAVERHRRPPRSTSAASCAWASGLGDDHRERLPDVPHAVAGERLAVERPLELAARGLDVPGRRLRGRPRSAAVYTASTPGIARASSRPSTLRTSAWGKMERTNTARRAPGISTFSR